MGEADVSVPSTPFAGLLGDATEIAFERAAGELRTGRPILIEGEDVEQTGRPNKRIYRLTDAGREAVAAWFEDTTDEPRVRDGFFMKLALAPLSGLADPIALINRQRRQHLNTMRSLSRLAAGEDRDNKIAQLLIEGAMLHLQADLDWLERCQEELE